MKSIYQYPKISPALNLLSLLLVALFMSPTAFAQSYTQESELETKYQNVIAPFWDSKVQLGSFTGAGNLKIHTAWIVHPQSKGSIVISSGRTEGSIKYKELFYDLYQQGYSVFTHDHRGQGQSGRMAANQQKGHVEDYDDFVVDLDSFVSNTVLPNSSHKPLLLCHSMGSAIGANYLIDHPDTFAKVIFASPMFGFNAPIPEWLANTIMYTHSFFNGLFSDEPWYFPGQGDRSEESFADNVVTHSETRYHISQKEFAKHNAALGGITTGWLKASLAAMQRVQDEADKITIPVLLMQAGGDVVVSNDAQKTVCDLLPNCQLTIIPDAQHELLLEADQYRNPTLDAIIKFISATQ